jgi:hypothetical protein
MRNGYCVSMLGPPSSLRPFPTIGRGTKPALSLTLRAGFSLSSERIYSYVGPWQLELGASA